MHLLETPLYTHNREDMKARYGGEVFPDVYIPGRGLCLARPPGAAGQGRAVRHPGGQYRGAGGGQGAGPARRVGYRIQGNSTERTRLYWLLKQNRGTEDPFLHRRMRKQWQGGRSHVTNRIVADSGSCTTKVWQGRARVCLQSLARSQRIIWTSGTRPRRPATVAGPGSRR